MRVNSALLTLVLFGAMAGTADAQAPAPPLPQAARAGQAAGTGVIRGRIVAADTGKPLRRTRVGVASLDAGGPPRVANTNADGRYEVKDLPAGRYRITATRSGYLQLQYGQRRPLEAARPVSIEEGQTIDRVDFALPRTGLIAGHVTDEVGDPVAGALVFALRTEYWQGRRQLAPSGPPARTDDTGQYRVVGLAPGTYLVRAMTRETWTVTRDGKKVTMLFTPTYFPGTPEVKDAQRVNVRLGQQISGYDFRMAPHRAVTVSGTALDSRGRPAASVLLAQDVSGPNGGIVGSGGTVVRGADGTFTVRDVAPGEYRLKAAGSDEVAVLPIVVAESDIDHISIVTSGGYSLAGSVTTESGAPTKLPRERVRLTVSAPAAQTGMQLQGQPTYRQQFRDDWTFSVSGLVGPARIRATLPDTWTVKAILFNGRDVTDTAVEGKGGEELSAIQIVLTDRVTTVSGRLADEKGTPLNDGTIVVFAADSGKWFDGSRYVRSVRPDAEGSYTIRGLPPGDYLAAAIEYVQDGMWNDPEYLESIRRYGQKLTLAEGESRSISLKLVTGQNR